jgi:pimeloyl-ACP methyl ester carboxylesterase
MLWKTVSIFFIAGIILTGCSRKIPNTWHQRIVKSIPKQSSKLYYEVSGKGQPVVLLHGFGASHYSFSRIVPALSKYFKVYALDLKGFGKSPKPADNRYSVYDQALLVDQFLQEHQLDKVILIGHSYGGGVALSLALLDPSRIQKLVLIDSASYKQQLPKLIRWLKIPVLGKVGFYLLPASFEVKESYRYAFYDDSKIPEDIVREYARNLYLPNARQVYLQTVAQLIPEDLKTVSRKYKTIHIPTLIIWGKNDIVIRKDKAYRLHRDIAGSKLVIIPKCGHIPHEEQPEKVLEILENFMLK